MNRQQLEKRLEECKRRAKVVRPHFEKARRHYRRLDRVFSYWLNRAYEAELELAEVRIIDPGMSKKKSDAALRQLIKRLTPEEAEKILNMLKGE